MASSKEYQMLFQLSAKLGGEFSSTFSTGQKAVSQLQNQINALNKTQADISAYQKQQTALDRSKEKLELYQRQLERLKGVEASTAAEEARLANEIDAKQQQVNKAQDAVDKNNAKLSEMGNALREAGVDTNNLADETARLKTEADAAADAQKKEAEAAEESGQSMRDAIEGAKAALETAGLIKGLEMVYNSLMECSNAAAQFETAMAGVKRTVGGNDEFISGLGETFKELSTEMPITATELANIATTAGQLGIAQGNVESFTQVMAQLATTTDLSADNAATMLAQFSNITGITDYDRLGSTVASLGDATATTASKVVEMSQGMAAAANIAGMSSTDILAISAAVGSLGIEAASGSTSMSTLISTLYKATQTGNNLEEYARVAGMSAQQFKQAWGEDAVGAMNAFIQGLNDTERNGKSAIVILDELGINNVRQTKAILGLASAGDLLSNTIAQANTAWNQNTALTEKASVMYNTTEAKMTMMQNAANNVQVAIGDALNPAIGAAYDALTGLLQPISEFIEANPALVQGITAFIGTIGTAAVAITGITAVTKLWAAANSILSLSIPGVGLLLGVAAAIGIGVGVISSAGAAADEAQVSFSELTEEYEKLQDEFEDNQHTIELVSNYKQLNDEAENLQTLLNGGFSTEISFKGKVPDDGKLTADQFIDDRTVKLTPDTAKTIAGQEFLSGATVELTPEQAEFLIGNDFLTDLTAYLTPEQADYLEAQNLITNGDTTVRLTPDVMNTMDAAGLLDGTVVELTGTAGKALAAERLLDDSTVTLTAEAVNKLQQSSFYVDSKQITFTAIADPDNMLTAEDFGISNQTLMYIAEIDPTSYADVESKAKALGTELAQVGGELDEAKLKLANMQAESDRITQQLNGTRNWRTKKQLQANLEELGTAIEDQKDKVGQLQIRYNDLEGEYAIAATAAGELAGKEEVLTAAKEALAGASDLVTLATGGNAAAFDEEAEAAARDAEAQIALARAKMYDNIGEQAKAYIRSISDATEAEEGYQYATEKTALAQKLAGMEAEQANEYYLNLLKTLDEMENDVENWSPDNVDYVQKAKEAEELFNIFTGRKIDVTNWDTFFTGVIGWQGQFGDLIVTGDQWNDVLARLNNEIVEYQDNAKDAEGTQSAFIQNLVNAITSGAFTEEQMRSMLTNALLGEANAADTVNTIMAEVSKGVAAEAEAAKDAAESTEELAKATDELNDSNADHLRSMDEIVTDIDKLVKSYKDAYEAAKSSIDGQFKLFDDASKNMPKASKKTTADYEKNLKSQEDYVKQYTENYEAVAQKLREAESAFTGTDKEAAAKAASNNLLAQLADGSAESAQILADLAKDASGDIQSLLQQYTDLESAKTKYAETVAGIQTNFDETMLQLQSELGLTVASMDFSTEAAENAKKSMDAFTAAIGDAIGPASQKAAQLAEAVNRHLKIKFSGLNLPFFASGTDNAPPGFAIVGENGPELVALQGGEQILSAAETRALAASAAIEPTMAVANSSGEGGGKVIHVDFNPQYTINGSANAEEIRSVLEEQTLNMKEQIREVLEEIQEDDDRRDYA